MLLLGAVPGAVEQKYCNILKESAKTEEKIKKISAYYNYTGVSVSCDKSDQNRYLLHKASENEK